KIGLHENPGAGVYNAADHSVKIGERMLTARNVLHEAMHALTANQIFEGLRKSNPRFVEDASLTAEKYDKTLRKAQSDERVSKPIRDLISQFFHAKKEAGFEGPAELRGNEGNKQAEGATREVPYGFTNLDEFISEAFTNPDFQEALNAIRSPLGGTVWDKFV